MIMKNGIPNHMKSCMNCARLNLPEDYIMGKVINGCAKRFEKWKVPNEKLRRMHCGRWFEKELCDDDYKC